MKEVEYKNLNLNEAIKIINTPKKLSVNGNSKLGKNILVFNTLAGIDCTSKTDYCFKNCYAIKNNIAIKIGSSVKNGYKGIAKSIYNSYLIRNNIKLWFELVNKELTSTKKAIIRLHVSGDFISIEHIKAWYKLAKEHNNKTFYVYSRLHSYNETFKNALLKLNSLSNFTVNLSFDVDNWNLDKAKQLYKEGFNLAFMGLKEELPNFIKWTNCPELTNKVVSCEDCKLCFNPKIKKPMLIFFPLH